MHRLLIAAVWLVTAIVWTTFMGPRLLVLERGSEAAQHQALIVLVVTSAVLLGLAIGVTAWSITRDRRRRPRGEIPTTRRAARGLPEPADATRATDLLGPGHAARRATRAAATRRQRRTG